MRARGLCAVVGLVSLAFSSAQAADEKPMQDGVSHGTVNIVLANGNGMVVLTDSMVTRDGKQLPDQPEQKLFKLDDRTVCAIAGFLAAPGPSDLYMSSGALLHEYAQQLSSKPPQNVREKLEMLSFLFQLQLWAIATIRAGTGSPTDLQNYESQVTVAGYDTDGTAKIGQIVLWIAPTGNTLTSAVTEPSITEVGRPLVFKLAGVREIAEELLKDPSSAKDEPTLAAYANSLREDRGQSLTIAQMKTLASRLAKLTADKCSGVGGEDQIAVVQDGRVLTLDQPIFPALPKALVHFDIVVDSFIGGTDPPTFPAMSEGAIIFPPGTTLLFLRTRLDHVRRPLDGNYFFGDSFNNCILVYNGGPFYFDKNNQVERTALFLGPDVKTNEPKVQELIHNFKWFGVSIMPRGPASN